LAIDWGLFVFRGLFPRVASAAYRPHNYVAGLARPTRRCDTHIDGRGMT
jgi:hypothetical protein